MTTGNARKYDYNRAEATAGARVININDHRRAVSRQKKRNTDAAWNMIFIGLCLSVLVVLFFH